MSEQTSNWPELAIQLYDKLTGRGAEITYDFENFEIFVPADVSHNAPTACWKVNGVLKIRTRDNATG